MEEWMRKKVTPGRPGLVSIRIVLRMLFLRRHIHGQQCLPKHFGSFVVSSPVCCMAFAYILAILENLLKYEKTDHLFRIRHCGFELFLGCVRALNLARTEAE